MFAEICLFERYDTKELGKQQNDNGKRNQKFSCNHQKYRLAEKENIYSESKNDKHAIYGKAQIREHRNANRVSTWKFKLPKQIRQKCRSEVSIR